MIIHLFTSASLGWGVVSSCHWSGSLISPSLWMLPLQVLDKDGHASSWKMLDQHWGGAVCLSCHPVVSHTWCMLMHGLLGKGCHAHCFKPLFPVFHLENYHFLFLSPTLFFHRKDCLVIVFNISSLFLFTFLFKVLIKSRLSISASLISTFTFHYFMYQHLKERKIQIHISENPREEKTRQIWLCQYWFRFKCLRRSKSRF